jgi:hypothetical protein
MTIVANKKLSDRRDRWIKQGERALGIGGLMVMSAQKSQDRPPLRMRGNQLNRCLLPGQAVCWPPVSVLRVSVIRISVIRAIDVRIQILDQIATDAAMKFRLLPACRRVDQPMGGPYLGSGLIDHNPKTTAAAKQIVEKTELAERS